MLPAYPATRLDFSRHDRRAEAAAPSRGRAPESRDQLRAAERDREGARPRGSARELGIQGGARAPAVRDVPSQPLAAAPLQALERAGVRYPPGPRGVWLPGHRAGPRDEKAGNLRADARR